MIASASSSPLRVLVVEDSLTIRKYLVHVLISHQVEVIGEAADGQRAVEMCRELKPDVITMDMILPGLSGLAATEEIMAYSPTPILIVSASVNRGELFQTYDALAAGAVDIFDKVRANEASADWEERFVSAVRMTARIRVITHPRARLDLRRASIRDAGAEQAPLRTSSPFGSPLSTLSSTSSNDQRTDLIALGASTGGPAAIVEILRALPETFPIPILIVLHLSAMFAPAFAEWLNTMSPIPAHYAADGEPLPPPGKPQIVLAPAGRHLVVEGRFLRLSDAPERHSCRPSVDVLFDSLAAQSGLSALLCLLTGMGKDGATGLLAARHAGLHTVAQDEASSVIFGMPGEAVRLHAAERVLPLAEIAPLLLACAGSRRIPARRGGQAHA